MDLIPPYDPAKHGLLPLLARQGRTADWFTADNGDPFSESNIARWSSHTTAKNIPFIYQRAVSERPEISQWITALADQARQVQAERNAPVPSVVRGPSLLLLGPTGVGKTYEAHAAIRELAVTGVVARWTVTTAADLYAKLRVRHGVDTEAEFAKYVNATVLLLDDIGAAKVSEFTEDINFRLINHRYENKLPTLLTSNVAPKELVGRVGDRVASRLNEMCQRVVITGPDRRRGQAA
ncbi:MULTISPECIES: ATP-binding protein [Streptomyces]|uniref:ATP-binding protein n=1 Tax=Streptomyces TaxID=1883 RepID=UPI0005B94AC8|nr:MULTISPECIES: ATP-binding protein [Streptomyces]MDP9953105.1 DNA replication protein DnaC [Streptomyces sp. DSM 41269]